MYNGAFTIWYDRHNGNRWCWRESNTSPYETDADDVRKGEGYPSRRKARTAVRDELNARAARQADSSATPSLCEAT